MKILVIGALPESLVVFRGNLLQSFIRANYQVTVMASDSHTKVNEELESWGVDFRAYPVKRNRLSPLSDIVTWYFLSKALRELQPDVILAYTIKPVIWSGLASRMFPNIRFYALITGLGYAFQGKTPKRLLLTKLVSFLYRKALFRADRVIFQNPDNLEEFVQKGIIERIKCALVNGSGVDVSRFKYTPLSNEKIIFLSIGRLLGEKGFREYARAARIVKEHYPKVIFQLLGPEDHSPDGIHPNEIQRWHQEGWLEYLGSTNDVRPFLQKCHVFVLPSYHEGLPRTALEAMAIGRPILTTDVPGCREVVIHGENGFLVPKANAEALAERIIWFIKNRDQWEMMGRRSRELAVERYDVHKVNAQMLDIMRL